MSNCRPGGAHILLVHLPVDTIFVVDTIFADDSAAFKMGSPDVVRDMGTHRMVDLSESKPMDLEANNLALEIERTDLLRRHAQERLKQLNELSEMLRDHLRRINRTRDIERARMQKLAVAEKSPRDASNQSMLSAAHILRRGDLKPATGLSPSTIYKMIASGEFPPPVKLGLKAVGWLKSDVDAWLAGRRALSS
jgi:prophage regulatory protein